MWLCVAVVRRFRIEKYQEHKTEAAALTHLTEVILKFPSAFVAEAPAEGRVEDWFADTQTKTIVYSPDLEYHRKQTLRTVRQIMADRVQEHLAKLSGIAYTRDGEFAQIAGIALHMTKPVEQSWLISMFNTAKQKQDELNALATFAEYKSYLLNNPLESGWPT